MHQSPSKLAPERGISAFLPAELVRQKQRLTRFLGTLSLGSQQPRLWSVETISHLCYYSHLSHPLVLCLGFPSHPKIQISEGTPHDNTVCIHTVWNRLQEVIQSVSWRKQFQSEQIDQKLSRFDILKDCPEILFQMKWKAWLWNETFQNTTILKLLMVPTEGLWYIFQCPELNHTFS